MVLFLEAQFYYIGPLDYSYDRLHCFLYWHFVVSFKIQQYETPLFFQIVNSQTIGAGAVAHRVKALG